MFFIRLIHACYSLLTIYFAYKITELISTKKNALQVGILLALIGIMPNFSARNLVELVCMPPLVYGFYILIKAIKENGEKNIPMRALLVAGIMFGCSVGIRYQTGLIGALIGAVLLFKANFKSAFVFGVTSLAMFFVTQIDDVLLWGGEPFQHLKGYFNYNSTTMMNYPGSPYAYLSLISLFILPPVSLFLMFGYLKNWKKQILIFLPTFGFLLFHILYPNRQERFILPALPFIVILGVIGWNDFVATSKFWLNRQRLLKGCWTFFWILNTAMMLIFATTFGKKSRVEAMYYLYQQPDYHNFVQEYSYTDDVAQAPLFYSGKWVYNYEAKKSTVITDFPGVFDYWTKNDPANHDKKLYPNYVLFYNDTDLDNRVARFKSVFPSLTYCTTIEAGWFDKLLHKLNPINKVDNVYIYKFEKPASSEASQ
jgi:hypothetical protein